MKQQHPDPDWRDKTYYEDFDQYHPPGPVDWVWSLLLLLAAGLIAWVVVFSVRSATAEDLKFLQPRAEHHGYDPNNETVKWFESLERQHCPTQPGCKCCGKGDAYEIVIDQEATIDGTEEDGVAHVIDGSAKEFPDGSKRDYIPNGTEFKFSGQQVTKLKQGNPTNKMWGFLSYWHGAITVVWCVVPLPPGV